jgi:hypothetical protein
MPKRNRKTLKQFFEKGKLPTESNFADLVDSTLNMEDDGFSRTPENGVEIRLRGAAQRLMSFFDDPQKQEPDWAITSKPGAANLNFARADANDTEAVSLRELPRRPTRDYLTPIPESQSSNAPAGTAGGAPTDGRKANDYQLEVRGSIRSTGRVGFERRVKADGRPHDITNVLEGCHALEVIAGVGIRKTGRYGLLHAFALNTCNPTGWYLSFLNLNRRIRQHQAWYLSRGDRLKLAWVQVPNLDNPHLYKLQLKSVRDWGADIEIRYSITELWFDPFMNNAMPAAAGSPNP